MKPIKIIIIILLILVILTSVTLIGILIVNKINENKMMANDDQNIEVEKAVSNVKTYREYNTVSYCTRQYIFSKYSMKKMFSVNEMYYKQNTLSVINYYVKGTIKDITDSTRETQSDYYLAVILNFENSKYKIKQITSEEYVDLINDRVEVKMNDIETYNFTAIDPTDEEICEMIFNDYQEKLIYEPQRLYSLITEKCRREKYNQYQVFKQYIQSNADNIMYSSLAQYKIEREVEYTKYNLIDSNGNNICIYETAPMQYTLEIN